MLKTEHSSLFTFFLGCSGYLVADSYGSEKLIRKWTKSVFFIRDQNMVRVKLMATVLFRHGFDY